MNSKIKDLFYLSFSDLYYEKILSICMILALATILAPLLILLGLKYGVISILVGRLIDDPVNREIKVMQTLELNDQWFDEFRKRQDVGFVIPSIMQGVTSIRVYNQKDNKKIKRMDIVPTSSGDPLILQNAGKIPKEKECVISILAAKKLNAVIGDQLNLVIKRKRKGHWEKVEERLQVISILPSSADALAHVYTQRKLVVDIENYREGRAVLTRGWEGSSAQPYLTFTDIFIVAEQALDNRTRLRLSIGTGLGKVKEINETLFLKTYPLLSVKQKKLFFYQLSSIGGNISTKSIKILKSKLRRQNTAILPWANIRGLIQLENQWHEIPIIGLSLSAPEKKLLGLNNINVFPQWKEDIAFVNRAQMILPDFLNYKETKKPILFKTITSSGELIFPIKVTTGYKQQSVAFIPLELMGTLQTANSRKVIFNTELHSFILEKSAYHGFRLYAKSIDNIIDLHHYFISQDIEVSTKAQEVEKLRALEHGLTQIFWIIAIVGIIGGTAALIASLFAAVQRKRREISVLRLMGLTRHEVFLFPIFQALILVSMSILFAFLTFTLFAFVINHRFAADLGFGENICLLPYKYYIFTFIFSITAAFMSSLFAARLATKIDPVEALRDE